MNPFRLALISTGGTIEKTYDELSGVLENRISVLDVMLASLTLHGVEITRVPLMNVDSLVMTGEDHDRIAEVVASHQTGYDGIVITHGTDRLAASGERILTRLRSDAGPRVPVVLTGAMRPWVMRTTDALQNMTEALLAVQLVPQGVYVAMHNRVLAFPGVVKDRNLGTFVRTT